MRKEKLILNPNILVVLGKIYASIVDIERNRTYLIPKAMGLIIQDSNIIDLSELKEKYGNQLEIEEYLNFLHENDLILRTKFIELYVRHDFKKYYDNSFVKSIILDIGLVSVINFDKLVNDLNRVGCRNLQIRVLEEMPIKKIRESLDYFKYSTVEYIEIFFNYSYSVNALKKLFINDTRVKKLIVFNQGKTEVVFSHESGHRSIIFLDKELSEQSCGDIESRFFVSNLEHVSESYNYNSCLNSKLFIAMNGDIKNCPSMNKVVGNITSMSLRQAARSPEVLKYWKIKKDKIHVCKDCEFRYVCTDCRAYVEDPKDILSKPLKCGYNPYTGEWSEWSTNPLKQKAIEFYGMQDLVAERKKNLELSKE